MSAPKSEPDIGAMVSECIAVRIRLLSRVITKLYDDALRPLGLKISQANILAATWRLGLVSPLKLCEILHLDPSTLSRNVERMRVKGWLEVVPSGDGREQPFRLTTRGEAILKRTFPAWKKAQEHATALLGSRGAALLRQATGKFGFRPDRK